MTPTVMLPEVRFWRHIEPAGDCWIWTGAPHGNGGYGRLYADSTSWPAHRWSYERSKGPVPEGLELDHLCRNRMCCNPDHLEAVTHLENVRRGNAAKRAIRCGKGHGMTPANSVHNGGGKIRCKTCINEWRREYRKRNNAV